MDERELILVNADASLRFAAQGTADLAEEAAANLSTRHIRAFVEAPVEGEANAGLLWFRASTEGVKRDGLNLVMRGVRYDSYMRNPVFLWAHDYAGETLPIGRVDTFEVNDDHIRVGVSFDQEDEFARRVESKYRRGFLNAVSIGWNILKREGRDVTAWDVLDVSGVPVPGDPDALMERKRRLERAEAAEAEADWPAVAAEMADTVWWPFVEDAESRARRYKALLPAYRRLGKTPPELLPLAQMRAMGAGLAAGLFLHDEMQVARESALGQAATVEALGQQVAALVLNAVTAELPRLIKAALAEESPPPEAAPDVDEGAVLAMLNDIQASLGG